MRQTNESTKGGKKERIGSTESRNRDDKMGMKGTQTRKTKSQCIQVEMETETRTRMRTK